jgi:hypothetical protein
MVKIATKPKAVKAPKQAVVIPSRDDEKLQDQNMIVNQLAECRQDAGHVQNLGAKASELIEKMPEYDKVADLEGQLELARKGLKDAKLNNGELQQVLDKLAEARTNAMISRKALSSLLVKFTAKYQQRNVLLGMEMHEVVLTAKIGKELESEQGTLPLWDE